MYIDTQEAGGLPISAHSVCLDRSLMSSQGMVYRLEGKKLNNGRYDLN